MKQSMTYEEAIAITGDVPSYALRSDIRALEEFRGYNEPRDEKRLCAARTVLKYRTRQRGKGVLNYA